MHITRNVTGPRMSVVYMYPCTIPASVYNIHQDLRVKLDWCTRHYMYAIQLYIVLDNNINRNFDGYTWLERAVYWNDTRVVRMLIEKYNPDLNTDQGYSIHRASRCGYENMLDIMISAGADVNINSYRGPSAVVCAILHARVLSVSKLLAAGAVLPQNALYFAEQTHIDRDAKVCLIKNNTRAKVIN